MQAELDATKSAAASDVSALKESFEHQKTQFREKLEDSTKQIDHLQKPGLLFGTNSIRFQMINQNSPKFPNFPKILSFHNKNILFVYNLRALFPIE